MAGRFSIEAVFSAVDRMTQPVNKMQRRMARFTKSVERNLRRVDRMAGKVSSGILRAGRTIGQGMAIAGGAAATALTLFNKSSVRAQRLAESVGAQVGQVEAISGAVKSAGFEMDHVVDIIEEMNNKIGESKGLKELSRPTAEAMQILNIEFKKLKRMSPAEQFQHIADKALQMKDSQKAAAAVDILMGGEANKLIGVLRQQGKTMGDITNRYERLNARTEKSRKGSQLFVQALNDAQFATTSLGQEIAGLVGEQLAPLIRKFTDFIVKNRELIKTKVLEWFHMVRDNFGEIVAWLEKLAIGIGVWFTFIAVLKTFIAVMTAVNIVMAMNPLGLIVLGVVAAIAAIAALIFWFNEIKAWFLGLPGWVDVAIIALAALTGPIGWLIGGAALIMRHWEPIKAFFKDLWQGVQDVFDGVMNWIIKKILSVVRLGQRVAEGAKKIGRFFGFGGDEDGGNAGTRGRFAGAGAPAGQMVSPQDRISRTISENTNTDRSEVVIRDETGRAEQRGKPGSGVLLEPSGSM